MPAQPKAAVSCAPSAGHYDWNRLKVGLRGGG